ncbi:MAG: M20/M25/M40 family metallo-hydrolase [Luteitalea sp.]|nr:M20/M25/M40 family metallo-hydrolase [Luteitalea sp.]
MGQSSNPGQTPAAPGSSGRAPLPYDMIREDDLLAHTTFLADDALEGRAPATRGGDLAARYIATQLALLGLEPGGDKGSWFQDVPIVESTIQPDFTLRARSLAGGAAADEARFAYGSEVVAFSGRTEPTIDVDGEVVFVGFGIVAPEYQWNDYAGVDVKGKVVLVMVNDPPATADEPDLFGGKALTYYGRWNYKYEEAARQGAAGAVLIHTDESATYPWQVVESSWTGTQYAIEPAPETPTLALQAWVTDGAARKLAELGGQDLDALRTASTERGAKPTPLGVRVDGSITQKVTRKQSPNVIGVLAGERETEAIVYTSHYDHLGRRDEAAGEDTIYNGAVDNASGVAALLEVADVFAHADARPGRSVYFVATAAEESGLLGSEYFAAKPPIPLERFAANINLDAMNVYGPTRDLVLLGAERSTLGDVAADVARDWDRVLGEDAHPERGYFFRSDHFPLAKAGVPALSYEDGSDFESAAAQGRAERYNETDYHQPSDEVTSDWDLSGMVQDVSFLADLGWRLASLPTMPTYRADDPFAGPRTR